jgi:hypothetical protein
MTITLADGWQIRYSTAVDGKITSCRPDDIMSVPMFADMGPDALEVSEEEFPSASASTRARSRTSSRTTSSSPASATPTRRDTVRSAHRAVPQAPELADEIGALYRGCTRRWTDRSRS